MYQRWHDAVLKFRDGVPPEHGAIWLTLYPNVMVEWYPHVLVVSTLFPQGPQKTLNVVEFFYPEEIAAFEREFVEAQQAAYMETCDEDDEIALRMDAGRKALLERGDDEVGPYQSPMEDGMQHFHEWYRRQMQGTVAAGALNVRAAAMSAPLLMVLATLLFAVMGVCVKYASAHYGAGELVFYRSADRRRDDRRLTRAGAASRCARRCRRCTSGAAPPASARWRCGSTPSAGCRWPPR